jgi:hypothetical protein
MTKTLFATLCAASLFTASAAMANTSADTAPDRLPAVSSSSTVRTAPAMAGIDSRAYEGGQAATPAALQQPMSSSPRGRIAMGGSRTASTGSLMAGQPYQSGAAN